MSRPSWIEYFMTFAYVASSRSSCLRRKVGCIIVKDKHILSTGYNGAPSRVKECEEIGCLREQLNIPSGERHEICRGVHAEQNSVAFAARYGVSLKDSFLVSTTYPCSMCAKLLIQAGITSVYYAEGYPDPMAKELFESACVSVEEVVWK